MITLYGWGPLFDCPSPSPYVMKTDIQLQMLGLEYNRAIADLDAVPKGKAPYVMDGGVLIEDSNFIRAHFEKKLRRNLAAGLSDEDSVTSWTLERMAEDHLTTIMMMERWLKDDNFFRGPALFFSDVPETAREGVMQEVRAGIAASEQARGMGRHSDAERMQLAEWDLQAIAIQLAGQDYLFGDTPTVADAAVSAVLISCATEYFDTPLSGLVRGHTNLVGYMDRMKTRFFAKNLWPVPEMA